MKELIGYVLCAVGGGIGLFALFNGSSWHWYVAALMVFTFGLLLVYSARRRQDETDILDVIEAGIDLLD
jgi:bacteriorhodopsin